MKISRREFIQLSGGAMLATGLAAGLPPGALKAWTTPHVGRVLRAAPVLQAPGSAKAVRTLWPDSVVALRPDQPGWYAVSGGVIRGQDVQPMVPYRPESAVLPGALPAAVTVVAPVALLRQWAAPEAPWIARIGYGGVLWALDRLPGDTGGWLALGADRDSPAIVGWSPAARWTALDPLPATDGRIDALRLERGAARIVALQAGRVRAVFPAAVPPEATPGVWALTGRTASGVVGEHVGAGWLLAWDGGPLYAAHWHHDQGGPGCDPGWALDPSAARWLYAHVAEDATIAVM